MAKSAPKPTRAARPAGRNTQKKKTTARRKPDPGIRARGLAVAAARSLQADKCQEVMVLDLRGRNEVTDYFVIASGSSDRQMHSAAEHIVELAEEMGESLYRSNLGEPRANWLILDFVDVVIHIMMPEARTYYDLEMLWGDAPRINARAKPSPGRNRAGLKPADLPGQSAETNRRRKRTT